MVHETGGGSPRALSADNAGHDATENGARLGYKYKLQTDHPKTHVATDGKQWKESWILCVDSATARFRKAPIEAARQLCMLCKLMYQSAACGIADFWRIVDFTGSTVGEEFHGAV